MLRIILGNPHLSPSRSPRYEARLEGEDDLLCSSGCPEFEAARALIAKGYPPEELMVTRWAGSDYDAIEPATLGHLAGWTVEESGRRGTRARRWSPFHLECPAKVGHPSADEQEG